MFTKWTVDSVKRRSNLRVSLVTKLKKAAAVSMPRFPEIENEIFPHKTPVIVHHLGENNLLYSAAGAPILVELSTGLVFPFLKIAIEYPGLLRSVYCADEAAAALLRGANLMARGTWGTDETFQRGDLVQITLIGEKFPLAIGVMELSGAEIEARPDGPAVTVLHILGDGLWNVKSL